MAYVHPVLVKQILDHLFGENWVDWEPETLEIELLKSKIPGLVDYKKDWQISNVIDALRAVLSQDSHALGEWHIFEKVVAAFANREVRFFDTQPPLPFELFMASECLDELFDKDPEYSDEVKCFIGLSFINNGFYAYPGQYVDGFIDFAISQVDALNTPQVKDLRKKFKSGLIAVLKNSNAVSTIKQAINDNEDPAAKINDVLSANITRVIAIYMTVIDTIENARDHFKEFVQQAQTEAAELPTTTPPEEEGLDPRQLQDVIELLDAGVIYEHEPVPAPLEPVPLEKEGRLLRPGIYRVIGEVGVDDKPLSEKMRTSGDVLKDTASGDGAEFISGGKSLKVIKPDGSLEEKKDFDFGV